MDSINRDAISRQIYKAAIHDDWDSVNHIFAAESWRLNAEISLKGETPLYIAVGTNNSHRFVEKLVNQIMIVGGGVEMLRKTVKVGRPYNALHLAGKRGNYIDSKLLVLNDPDLPQTVVADDGGTTPLELAASKGHEETVRYLMSVTRDEVGESGTSPFRGTPGANILTHIIATGLYDVALYIVKQYPDLVGQGNYTGSGTAFSTLAAKENAFPSGSCLTFWERIVYSRDSAVVTVRDYWIAGIVGLAKEVDKFMEPAQREHRNRDGKTPRMLFREEHKQLLIDAQQWTQGTSSSSIAVAALLVTIAFAALFTVPGGNKDTDGQAIFLKDAVFLLFAISDSIANFCSFSSVLMFLSTLTHSSQDDFLYALPLRLTFGLIQLFVSPVTTMIAFSATLVLLVRDKIQWIAVPVTLMACVPVILFLWLQYPLLHELIRATFGKNIFGKQNSLLLH